MGFTFNGKNGDFLPLAIWYITQVFTCFYLELSVVDHLSACCCLHHRVRRSVNEMRCISLELYQEYKLKIRKREEVDITD